MQPAVTFTAKLELLGVLIILTLIYRIYSTFGRKKDLVYLYVGILGSYREATSFEGDFIHVMFHNRSKFTENLEYLEYLEPNKSKR